jgi:hypothetical protein
LFQSINIEGEITNSELLDASAPSKRCEYDKLELAEQLEDLNAPITSQQQPLKWKMATTICGFYPNSSILR